MAFREQQKVPLPLGVSLRVSKRSFVSLRGQLFFSVVPGKWGGPQEPDSEKTCRKRSRARWLSPSGKASNPTVPL